MSHSDEHEAKAREWLYWRDKTKSTDIDSLAALLHSVDAEARREEAKEWEREAQGTIDALAAAIPTSPYPEFNKGKKHVLEKLLFDMERRRGAKR